MRSENIAWVKRACLFSRSVTDEKRNVLYHRYQEEIQNWRENAARIIPQTFNSTIMCIGSEIRGTGACNGDNGGPGFIFDTGDGYNLEKYVQVGMKKRTMHVIYQTEREQKILLFN